MARKSHRSLKKVKNSADKRHEISKLLETRKQSNVIRESSSAHNDTKKDTQKTALEEQFNYILNKFKIPEDNKGPSNITTWTEHPVEDNELHDSKVSFKDTDDDTEKPVSKRKLRKLDQPSLSQLKSETSYPQMVEWYDCNAMYPHLLVSIKTSKNVVPVPAHWQMKREYLSGRSMLQKKPFELPDIIKQTDIEQMRETLPNTEDVNATLSSKDISRARVQPKLGALDIDYDKLRDVFFKLGAKWKPDVLLPFGDLYYENRNLYEEFQWQKLLKEKLPGKISAELRDIMHLPEGQLPPWCMKMKDIGMPPGYPSLKVAGLNWDIGNLKGDVYGKIEKSNKTKKSPFFGAIVSLEEDDEEQTPKEADKREQEKQETTVPASDDFKKDPFAEGMIAQQDEKKKSQRIETEINRRKHNTPKQLYTVLPEKRANDITNNGSSKYIYDILGTGTDGSSSQEDGNEENSSKDTEEDQTKSFRF